MNIHDLHSAATAAESLCRELGLEIVEQKEIPYGRQFKVRQGGAGAIFNVYYGKKGLNLVVQGADNEAKRIVEGALFTRMRGVAPVKAEVKPRKTSDRPVQEIEAAYDEPWMGTDESGKGDYFGPLVTAGVIVDPDAVPLLRSLGVDDSKKITDAKIPGMAAEIRKICYGRYKVLSLKPEKYNELYEKLTSQGKKLNSLLAWAHASVIENLLETQPVNLVIADKFADESLIENRLKKLGRSVKLIQVPKAEQNLAVAAASILARDALLRWHSEAKAQHGISLPKGASVQVIQAGKTFVKNNGRNHLRHVAKLHFKTTEEVLL